MANDRQMQFVRCRQHYQIELVDGPMPEPAADEVLLAARRTLISPGSELRRYRRYEGYDDFTYPVDEMGYSFCGEVVAVGEQVSGTIVGQRVSAVKRHATHVTTRLNVPETRLAVMVPDGVSDDEATFGPLLRSTLNWLRLAAVDHTSTVAICGQGLVGALLLQAVRLHSPRRVVVTDAIPLRLELARRLGADEVVQVGADGEADPVAAVRSVLGGGADVVIDTVGGAAIASFTQAARMCRAGGRLVYVGMHTQPLEVPMNALHDITVIGSRVGYDRSPAVMQRGLELVGQRALRPAELITHRFDHTAVADAYRLLDERPAEALAVVIDWPAGQAAPAHLD